MISNPVLKERLSETEMQDLIQKVQVAIVNKDDTDIKRGLNMSDEKYIIDKATLDEIYDIENVFAQILQKAVDRIEVQDRVIMKMGAAMSELMAKDMMEEGYGGAPMDPAVKEPSEGEDLRVESEIAENLDEADEENEEVGDELLESKKELGELEGGVPSKHEMPSMMAMSEQKSAFEAGWKAAQAEMQKKNGVPTTPAEFNTVAPRGATATGVAQQTGQDGGSPMQKNFTDEEMVKLGPTGLIQWMKEQGIY
jgi:hypothetical protein